MKGDAVMIKLSFGTKFAGITCSSVLALVTFGSMIYLTSPQIRPPVNQQAIDFSKINIGTPAFAASSPFNNVVPRNAIDNAPTMEAPAYIPGSPMVPQMPSMPGYAGRQPEVLRVIGVLPPDVVILQKGGKTLTAKSGSATEFGAIGTISKTGAMIDGAWIEFSK